jgi:hypothetical protein
MIERKNRQYSPSMSGNTPIVGKESCAEVDIQALPLMGGFSAKRKIAVKSSIAGKLLIVVLGAILAGCASEGNVSQSSADQSEGSGFLRDYSALQETSDTQGNTIKAWVSPKLTPANYNAVLLDPLVFYPEPRPTEQVSAAELQRIIAYANDVLRRSLGQRFKVVDRAGPGVLRIRGAFTGVAAQGKGLKPYQFVPIAFVATMASRAVMGAPQQAFIVIEVEGTDSLTGELLAQRLRVGTGEKLAAAGGEQVITLETVKPLLDELASQAFPELARYVAPR